jgi:hypothetical protein
VSSGFYYMTVGSRPDPNDPLTIPDFLDRREFVEEDGEIMVKLKDHRLLMNEINGHGPRVWAPMRKIEDLMRKKQVDLQIWVDNVKNSVQVVTTKKENLQRYDNFDDFMKYHDFDDHPFVKSLTAGDVSYIVVKATTALTGLSDELKDMEKVKVETVEQNGVKRPKPNSVTGIAWASFDHMHANGVAFKVVFEKLKENGMNPSTIRTQFAHWRKFNNVSK